MRLEVVMQMPVPTDQGFLGEDLGAWHRCCASLFLANCAAGYVALSLGLLQESRPSGGF